MDTLTPLEVEDELKVYNPSEMVECWDRVCRRDEYDECIKLQWILETKE